MNNLQAYQHVFMEAFGVEPEVLNDTFTFQTIQEWDSMAHMSLISQLEETFDVFFETEDILNYGSYLNGMEILRRYGIEF